MVRDENDTRLNLVYKGAAMRKVLDEVQDLGHHGTVTDAVATALRLYGRMLRERENGNRIVVTDHQGGSQIQVL